MMFSGKSLEWYLILVCLSCIPMVLPAQSYYGAGNSTGVTVTASSVHVDTFIWTDSASAQNVINGSGMLHETFEAARFLAQATLGYDSSHIEDALALGYEGWIDDQFNQDTSFVLPYVDSTYYIVRDSFLAGGGNIADFQRRPVFKHLSYGWWWVNMTNEDLLRHRVATALSEILVVSKVGALDQFGDALGAYYDILLKNAFGNYQDLLTEVSLSPSMGVYLTHVNNPKADTALNIFPDENYAREILQLFTIGLYDLNLDGSPVLDDGQLVPAYGQDDIRDLAKVFTGLSYSSVLPGYGQSLSFGMGRFNAGFRTPMMMYEDRHETGDKIIFETELIPDGQTGMEDIEDAIQIIFDHPNVGPFLAYRLIQRLVKSNPSPAYVERVASAFNDNGSGVRGDMKAVIKAILLDIEARGCEAREDDRSGRLIEPLLRYTHLARALKLYHPSSYFWNRANNYDKWAGQGIMSSPSVFNWFTPFDAPNGPILDQGLVAPEFTIHDARTSIGYINEIRRMTHQNQVLEQFDLQPQYVVWDWADFGAYVNDPEQYINWLDTYMCRGEMSLETRNRIRTALKGFQRYISWNNYDHYRPETGLFLLLISPDYVITR